MVWSVYQLVQAQELPLQRAGEEHDRSKGSEASEQHMSGIKGTANLLFDEPAGGFGQESANDGAVDHSMPCLLEQHAKSVLSADL